MKHWRTRFAVAVLVGGVALSCQSREEGAGGEGSAEEAGDGSADLTGEVLATARARSSDQEAVVRSSEGEPTSASRRISGRGRVQEFCSGETDVSKASEPSRQRARGRAAANVEFVEIPSPTMAFPYW